MRRTIEIKAAHKRFEVQADGCVLSVFADGVKLWSSDVLEVVSDLGKEDIHDGFSEDEPASKPKKRGKKARVVTSTAGA